MQKKLALLFSGQGAQKVGMGVDLARVSPAVARMLSRADEVLGFPLSRVMAEGPLEELTRTSRCQPALYVHGLACWEVVRERVPGLEPSAAAGLSLGEFTAHAAAGTFSFEDGLELVHRRGQFMEEACKATAGTMAAMIGGDEAAVRQLAESCGIDVANLNAPGQIVVSGAVEGVREAVAKAKESGCRMGKELQVAGAYHSRLMADAQDKLSTELTQTEISTPNFHVISNFTASPALSPEEIRQSLEQQVTGSVRWSESMTRLLDGGHEVFLELGPGGVLAGLMGRIRKGTRVLNAGDLEGIQESAETLSVENG